MPIRSLVILAFAFAAASGCYKAEPPPKMSPLYRFADAEERLKAETNVASSGDASPQGIRTDLYPVTSLEDVARYTIGNRVRGPLYFAPNYSMGSEASLALAIVVTAPFQVGDRVVMEPDLSWHGESRRPATTVAEVQLIDEELTLHLELPIPPEYANEKVGVHVKGTVVAKETAFFHRTQPVRIPPRAYLDFAIAVEESAWLQGSVAFRIKACEGSDCRLLYQEVLDPSIADERNWQDRRIELDAVADKEVSFSFESELLMPKEGGYSLPVWGNPTVYAPLGETKPGVNIVFLSIDTLAANHLSTYGYKFPTSPFLDGVLAREGLVFEKMVSAATTTPQSHMSMFTSVQPCQHGVTTGLEVVHPQLVTIAEVLRASGYETGAVTEDGWLGYQHGFGRGFNFYAENKSANVMIPEGQVDLTLKKARAWITRNDDKPFFLFLHTFQVHDPYTPPEDYKKLFVERDGKTVDESSPWELRELVAYDQEIRYTDDQLKAFFEFLRSRNLLDNTVFVITSDHGEEFLEHGEWGHGRNLYEHVTHVPLILWGPGLVPRGERSPLTAGHIDLMPTILALAGVDAPAQATGRDLLDSAAAAAAASDYRYTESRTAVVIVKDREVIDVHPPSFMVRQGNRKVARYREPVGFRFEAYDLDRDPGELQNLLPAQAPAFEEMKALLNNYESACAERSQRKVDAEPVRTIELDPEREKKLRALGYLQ